MDPAQAHVLVDVFDREAARQGAVELRFDLRECFVERKAAVVEHVRRGREEALPIHQGAHLRGRQHRSPAGGIPFGAERGVQPEAAGVGGTRKPLDGVIEGRARHHHAGIAQHAVFAAFARGTVGTARRANVVAANEEP